MLPQTASITGFVIGPEAKDAHSHAAFPGVPHDIVKVTARVRVTKAIDHGLNFFAVQVNFPNKTWAHGGIQLINGRYLANWGGLVNRGGGSGDYQKKNPAADLQLMQNGSNDERSGSYAWAVGSEYAITIERGAPVMFPPGEYVFIGKGPHIFIGNPRTMWTWNLTIKPVDASGPVKTAKLYNTADRIASFYLWNECNYGCRGNGQSAAWSMPVYTRIGSPGVDVDSNNFRRF
jgi:hypothetical protein